MSNGTARDVVERIVRQLFQIYGPAIAVILTSTAPHGDWLAIGVALASAIVLTTLKYLSKLHVGPGAPLGLILLDRAGSAAVIIILGLGVTDLASLLSLDWGEAGIAAAVAAALAVLAYFASPPALAAPTTTAAGRHSLDVLADPDDPAPEQSPFR
jgi:hypothetical protein